jgi:carbon-monoxide dehydrogenase large subunit
MSNVIGIGARPLRKEDRRFLTGRGNYVADIKRPDMVAGVFIRSPHAHASISVIEAAAALAMPGVLAVFTGEHLKASGVGGLPCGWGITGKDGLPMKEPPHPALAQGKVRHVGDPVAFVVAETREQAQSAAEAVVVDYDVLPAVVGVLDAIKRDAPLLFDDAPNNLCCDWALGDRAATDAAFRKAAHVAPSASSTTGSSVIQWSRARRSPSTIRPPNTTPYGPRANFRTSCACSWAPSYSTFRSTSSASWRRMSAAASALSNFIMPKRR